MVATNRPTAAGATTHLRDIKPPVTIPNGWLWAFWAIGVLAVAALIFLAWRYWNKRKNQRLIEEVIPPHVRAREKLGGARAVLAAPREFCFLVWDKTRVYLGEGFEFYAPGRPPREFVRAVTHACLFTRG